MHNKSKISLYKKTILLTSIFTINNESTAMEDLCNVPLPRLFTTRSDAINPFMLASTPEENIPGTPLQLDNNAERKEAAVPANKPASPNPTPNASNETIIDQNANQPQNNALAPLQQRRSKNAEDISHSLAIAPNPASKKHDEKVQGGDTYYEDLSDQNLETNAGAQSLKDSKPDVSPKSLTASVPELSSDSHRKDNMTHARSKSLGATSSLNTAENKKNGNKVRSQHEPILELLINEQIIDIQTVLREKNIDHSTKIHIFNSMQKLQELISASKPTRTEE